MLKRISGNTLDFPAKIKISSRAPPIPIKMIATTKTETTATTCMVRDLKQLVTVVRVDVDCPELSFFEEDCC